MIESTDDDRLSLVVCLWLSHPEATVSADLASTIFRELCADPDVPARRGLGIPIRFRSSVSPDEAPAPIPFGAAKHTAVFVLADDKLVADPAWRSYVEELTKAKTPVTSSLLQRSPPRRTSRQDSATGRQFVCRSSVPSTGRVSSLEYDVKNDLCRLLDPEAKKVTVFLSHAKHDGLEITTAVRRHLHEHTKLDDFFDAADIPDGARFAESITKSAGSLPVLLAVQTDGYGSREWCRLEVLEAKRRRVPIVVLAAIQVGEAR